MDKWRTTDLLSEPTLADMLGTVISRKGSGIEILTATTATCVRCACVTQQNVLMFELWLNDRQARANPIVGFLGVGEEWETIHQLAVDTALKLGGSAG
jgi:hypothetical protein